MSLDPSRITRWRSTATTWTRKTVALLRQGAEQANKDERWLVGYDAERFLVDLLSAADQLVPLLNDDQLEDVARAAGRIADRLRARRLAQKLEQVEGRLPAEAEHFLARAAELRGKS